MAKDRYSREIADRICELMAAGQSLAAICRAAEMPHESTVRGWVARDRDGFGARYRALSRFGWRETQYSAELAERICDELAHGRTLREVCRAPGMPAHCTVLAWAQRDFNGFAADYRFAREFGYQAMMDEMMDIADDSRGDWRIGPRGQPVPNPKNIARARLRLRERQRRMAEAMPKNGERLLDQGAVPREGPWAKVLEELARRKAKREAGKG